MIIDDYLNTDNEPDQKQQKNIGKSLTKYLMDYAVCFSQWRKSKDKQLIETRRRNDEKTKRK